MMYIRYKEDVPILRPQMHLNMTHDTLLTNSTTYLENRIKVRCKFHVNQNFLNKFQLSRCCAQQGHFGRDFPTILKSQPAIYII